MQRLLLCSLCIFFYTPTLLSGQTLADTLTEINVREKKNVSGDDRINSFSPGQKVNTFDSASLQQYQMQSVSNLLSQQTPIFIKSYGINGLATLNFRGSSAAQSQVYWEGVPLQNASLGIADVSTLPVYMISKLHIVYGSSSALWGSGNVGGALLLESEKPDFTPKRKIEIALGNGSFDQYQAAGKINLSTKKISFSTNLFAQTATNDFKYEDELGRQRINTNASLKGLAVLSRLGYKFSEKDIVSLSAWLQNYDRRIPPALFESYSVKQRKDESIRVLIDWNHKAVKRNYYAKTCFIEDNTEYTDTATRQNSENKSSQFFFETGTRQQFGIRHQVILFTPIQVSWMNNAAADAKQDRVALALAYTYSDVRNKLKASVSFREEQINDRNIVLPGINISYALFDNLTVRANVQRTYRAPTLNELYFSPGGNKTLKAEHGWNEDAGYKFERKITNRLHISHDVSIFNRMINDWIIWFGGSIWTPHNIATVHSRGLEAENILSYDLAKLKFHFGYNATYVKATTVSSYIPNDQSSGKQIPYTPNFISQLNSGFTFKKLYLNYNFAYTGYRYMNMDETGYLKPYDTHNLHINYQFQINRTPLSISFQANNLANKNYEVVAARVMPGFNWLAALMVTL